MLRRALFHSLEQYNDPFRHRGKEITRIEAFSDAVFAFSISLLIMSLEVPQTFGELMHIVHGFLPFLCTVALVFIFWHQQYKYFRHYGLNDNTSIWLNALLLTIILFYIYPLKFLFSLLFMFSSGMNVFPKAAEQGLIILRADEMPQLIALYSTGYALIWSIFFILHVRAWWHRELLDLNTYEMLETRKQVRGARLNALIGIIALVFALLNLPELSGITYIFIPIALIWNERVFKKALKKEQRKKKGKTVEVQEARANKKEVSG
jgi:uncharacterized membrane protein